MLDGLIIGAVIGLIVMGLGMAIAFSARRSYVTRPRPSRLLHFDTARDPDTVRQAIHKMISRSFYKLVEDVPEHDLLTMGSNPTGFSWGFFFPIYIEPSGAGETRVTVGIESKVLQYGPVVAHHHRKALTAIEDAVRAP